jgi:type II secretory pathway component PulM
MVFQTGSYLEGTQNQSYEMKPTTRKILEQLKAAGAALDPQNTEGGENHNLKLKTESEDALVKAAMEAADRKKWAAMLAEEGIERTAAPMKVVKKPNQMRWVMGIAASLLLVATVIWLMRPPAESPFSVENYLTENRYAAPQTRMGTADPNATWQAAKTAYQQRNDAEVVRLLSPLPNLTDEQAFYLALSQLQSPTPDYVQAAATFAQNVAKNNDFVEESRWFLALCYVKMDKKSEAKQLLETIIAQKGWNATAAQQLLKSSVLR